MKAQGKPISSHIFLVALVAACLTILPAKVFAGVAVCFLSAPELDELETPDSNDPLPATVTMPWTPDELTSFVCAGCFLPVLEPGVTLATSRGPPTFGYSFLA